MPRQKDTPEEAEIHASFRKTRDDLIKKIKEYENSSLKLDEVTDAIRLQYSVVARLEDELSKVPEDEELQYSLDEFVETDYDFDEKAPMTKIPEKTYNRLLKRLEKLEAKCSRVNLLNTIGRHARVLTQNITDSAKIGELQANTKRIELTTHNATLLALSKMFYLALSKQGVEEGVLVAVSHEMKRISKDYPLVEAEYEVLRNQLFAEPVDTTCTVEEADYMEVEDKLSTVNSLITTPVRRSRK